MWSRTSMLGKALALLASVSIVLPSFAADQPVLRHHLKAPVLFTGSTTSPGGGGDGDPPDEHTTSDPLTLHLGTPFPSWATVGDSFSSNIIPAGGVAPYTTSTVGAFPGGLQLDTSGVAGIFSAPGDFEFRIRAVDDEDIEAFYPLMSAPPIAVAVSSPLTLQAFAPATIPVTKDQEVVISAPVLTGGRGPMSYAIDPDDEGAVADPSTGAITFSSATTGLKGPFALTATDHDGRQATRSVSFDVTDQATLNYASTGFTAVFGQSGIAAAAPSGLESGTKTFSVTGGALPAGLALNASTGEISGTPTASGTGTVTVRVSYPDGRSASQTLSWSIAAPLGIAYRSPVFGAIVGTSFAPEMPTITGGVGGTLSYSVTAGAMGPGMVLNPETGGVSMTPTEAGNYAFTITANEAQSGLSASVALQWQVYPTIALTYSAASYAGVANQSLTIPAPTFAGGNGTVDHYAIATGSLPSGMTLNASTGAISGTPTSVGAFPVSVLVEDTSGFRSYASVSIGVQTDLALSYGSASYSGSQNASLSVPAPTVSGGTAAGRTFSIVSGTLPSGLSLNPSTGAITGTPTGFGSASVTIQVLESGTGYSASQSLTFDIGGTLSMNYSSTTHVLTVGTAFGLPSPTVTGGNGGTRTWSVSSGALPAGISLNASNGQLTGTPTTAGGPIAATIQVSEAGSGLTSSTSMSFTTYGQLTIAYSASSFLFTTGTSGTQVAAPTSNGGQGAKAFTLSGALPTGFSLNSSTGAITGTTSATGSSGSATVQVADQGGRTASQTLSWQVLAPVTVSLSNVADRRASTAVSMTIASSGGQGTTTISTGGTLPAGLTRSGTTISGTLSTVASATTYNFSVTASNAGGSATQNYSITVYPVLTAGSPGNFSFTSGNAYTSATPSKTGLRGTATWSLAPGSTALPTGIALNTSSGVITASATTIAPAVVGGIVLRLKDSTDNVTADSSAFTITINGASCTNVPFGSTLAHNGTLTAFQSASVSYGQLCSSEVRTCNNGTLSGSYTNQSCSVQPGTANDIYPANIKSLLTDLGIPLTSAVNTTGTTTFNHSSYNGTITIDLSGNVTAARTTNVTYFGNYCTSFVNILKSRLSAAQQNTLWVYGFTAMSTPYQSDGLWTAVTTACRSGKGNYTTSDPNVIIRNFQ